MWSRRGAGALLFDNVRSSGEWSACRRAVVYNIGLDGIAEVDCELVSCF